MKTPDKRNKLDNWKRKSYENQILKTLPCKCINAWKNMIEIYKPSTNMKIHL